MTSPSRAAGRVTATKGNVLLDSLIDSLLSERHLVEELTVIMQRQRAAVTAEDLQGVDDTVYAVQRVLHTLSEAFKRRHALNERLGFASNIALRDIIDVMGDSAPEALRVADRELQDVARTLADEVAVNRQVLRRSLASGDVYARARVNVAEPQVG